MNFGDFNTKLAALGLGLLVAAGICFAVLNREPSLPPEPLHRVGDRELPVTGLESMEKLDADDFQLVQLPDGHDYWVFRRRANDRGYGGMAHSPACAKCTQAARLQNVETSVRGPK